MRNDKTLLLIAVGLLLGWGIGATDDPVKVGFVDVEQVLATAESGKAAREELERKSRDAQARLAPLVEGLEAMQKELQAKQFVMSEDAVRAKQLDLVELKNRYETKAKEEEGQFKVDQQRLIGPLLEKLESVIFQNLGAVHRTENSESDYLLGAQRAVIRYLTEVDSWMVRGACAIGDPATIWRETGPCPSRRRGLRSHELRCAFASSIPFERQK